nr:DUF4142 domain-containing protein [Pyrinomonadaceae bacterium]
MFKHKTEIAASIAAGMFIAFSGATATAQQTTTSQSGSSQQSSTSTSGSTGQQTQTNTPQNQSSTSGTQTDSTQTGGTQSGATGQQSGSMSRGQGANQGMSGSAESMISNDDRKFMMAAAEGGMSEVEMAKVALEKASSDSVKQFAQKMIDDHTKANDKLKEIASKKGVTLPTAPDAKRQRTMDKLQQLSGAEFDRAYMKEAGNKDHDKQAKLFQKQADRGKDAEVKAFAAETLPTVQMHLQMARDMSGQMGG